MKKAFFIFMCLLISAQLNAFEANQQTEQAKAAISSHSNEIRMCYRDNEKKLKGAKGKVFIDFEINEQGVLIKSDVNEKKTTLKSEILINCMQEKFKKWTFPVAPKGETLKVTYPFAFKKI